MTLDSVKAYLTSGIDEAILAMVKGSLRYGLAAALVYLTTQLSQYHPTTTSAVVAVGILSQAIKGLYIYLGTPAPTATGPADQIA